MGLGDSDPLDTQTPTDCLILTLVRKELWKVVNLEKSLADSKVFYVQQVERGATFAHTKVRPRGLYHRVLLRYLGNARGKVIFLSLRIVPPGEPRRAWRDGLA